MKYSVLPSGVTPRLLLVLSKRQISLPYRMPGNPSKPAGKAIRERCLARSFSDYLGQIPEMNPDVALRGTRKIHTPDLMKLLRRFPFVQDAVGICVLILRR